MKHISSSALRKACGFQYNKPKLSEQARVDKQCVNFLPCFTYFNSSVAMDTTNDVITFTKEEMMQYDTFEKKRSWISLSIIDLRVLYQQLYVIGPIIFPHIHSFSSFTYSITYSIIFFHSTLILNLILIIFI